VLCALQVRRSVLKINLPMVLELVEAQECSSKLKARTCTYAGY
jgi:hypothetical protein